MTPTPAFSPRATPSLPPLPAPPGLRHDAARPMPVQAAVAMLDATQACLSAPFDAMRSHYAGAVAAGLMPRSLLASARVERAIDSLEKLCLGPLARRR